jgi:hypothetical protein
MFRTTGHDEGVDHHMRVTANDKDMRVGQVARQVPSTKGEGTIHTTTVLKWIRRGVRLPDGTILRLRARKRPGGWMVNQSDLDEFLERYATAAAEERDLEVSVSARRQRELDRVDRRLKAHGLGLDHDDQDMA